MGTVQAGRLCHLTGHVGGRRGHGRLVQLPVVHVWHETLSWEELHHGSDDIRVAEHVWRRFVPSMLVPDVMGQGEWIPTSIQGTVVIEG